MGKMTQPTVSKHWRSEWIGV